MKDNIISQLKELQKINPDAQWKREQRNIIMQQVANTAKKNKDSNNFIVYLKEVFTHEITALTKPAYSLAIIALLLVGGGFFSISAASEATPGSLLYTAKIVGEKTQLNLAYKQENKIKLGVKFAERRANEIQGLIMNNDHNSIESVAGTLSEGIEGVQNQLEKINNNDPVTALTLAKDIDTKTNKLRESLKQAKGALSESSMSATRKLDNAIRSVENTGLQALNTIVSASKSSDETAKSEASDRVATKLKSTKEQISNITDDAEAVFSAGLGKSDTGMQIYQKPNKEVTSKTREANKIIQEAEKLLDENNYVGALDKINETQQLLDEAVEVVDEGIKTLEEQQSTSTPMVKGIIEPSSAPSDAKAMDDKKATEDKEQKKGENTKIDLSTTENKN